ncbi:MAG: FKBP-type peptidyl-prolyl cis-trans isomerase [Cytophagales bacterium]|nr:FKBP-type peptidyl-prolyl cis-trans isomerase [Cytophagales bacterium]
MKNIFSALCLGAIALTSCGPKFEKNEYGLDVHYFKKAKDREIVNGNILLGTAVLKNIAKDSVIQEFGTKDYTPPFSMPVDTAQLKNIKDPIAQSVAQLRKGDSVEFRIVADSLFKGQPIPPQTGLKPGDMLSFSIGIDKVLTPEEMKEYAEELRPKLMEAQRKHYEKLQEERMREEEKRKAEQLAVDDQKIVEYISSNNLKAEKTESGLRYIIAESKDGKKIEPGDVVHVHYAGKNMKDELFDTSIKSIAEKNDKVQEGRDYKPLKLTVGAGQVIAGWDEGLALLKEGDKATFIIPSTLAYGNRNMGPGIGPNEVLVFDVEIVKVDKAKRKEESK